MKKILFLFSLYFMNSGISESTSSSKFLNPKLSKEFCQALLTMHISDPDVAYHSALDAYREEVLPADLEDGLKLKLPKIVPIPIKVDLGAYLRNSPSEKFQQTYSNLNKNNQNVKLNNTIIHQSAGNIINNSTQIADSLQQITSLIKDATTARNTAISANPAAVTTSLNADRQALTKFYTSAISSLNSSVNNLTSLSQAIVDNVDILQDSRTLLSNQISPRETNGYILQTNANLVKQNQIELQSTSNALADLSSSFELTQTLLSKTLETLQTNSAQLGSENAATLTESLNILRNSLNTVTATAQNAGTVKTTESPVPSQQTQVSSLINSFHALEALQNKNLAQIVSQPSEADLGQVTYNFETGELLYNGQALEAGRQTLLKKECEEILKQ